MHKNLAPSASTTRFYGASQTPYTPLDTLRTPRIGQTNDLIALGPGLIGVVLQDSSVAQVDESDYQLLRASGWLGRWTQRKVSGNNYYPSINHGDKIWPIVRLILDAQKGEKVYYRNGDTNNLTRANLILKAKGSQEIGFSNRSCPQAPTLSSEERIRSIDRVSEAVGTATPEERIATGIRAVYGATSNLLALGRQA